MATENQKNDSLVRALIAGEMEQAQAAVKDLILQKAQSMLNTNDQQESKKTQE